MSKNKKTNEVGLHSIGKDPLTSLGEAEDGMQNSGKPNPMDGEVKYPDEENMGHVHEMMDSMSPEEQKYAHVHLTKKMEPKPKKSAPGEDINDFADKEGVQS